MTTRKNTHPAEIKAMVEKSGKTLQDIGVANGIQGGTVRKSIRVCCPVANRAIAKHLGKSLHDLWPEWFDADGNRILKKPVAQVTSARSAGQCQKKRAA